MLKREYDGQNCSIAGALEIVGERWTLLIIRDVFLGLHRFGYSGSVDCSESLVLYFIPKPPEFDNFLSAF